MTSSSQDSADQRFERLLIDSAERDEMPRDVDAAWDKFGAALNGASLLAAGAGGALAARHAQRWLAAKWLIWGALTGSALTALSLRPSHDRASEASRTLPAPTATPAAPSPPLSATSEVEAQPRTTTDAVAKITTTAATTTPKTTHKQQALPRTPLAPKPSLRDEPTPSQSSTLSAQVALLDAARTAIAAGALTEALRLSDRYRADFPSGQLAPEAEVVAIEALTLRGERQAASERAARFLARYPGDPHTARVKWLVR
jgi:hypothetical protein